MMLKVLFFFFGIIAFVAEGIYVVENPYWLTSNHQARNTSSDNKESEDGAHVNLDYKKTLFENEEHQLKGRAFANSLGPSDPMTYGWGLSHLHKPTGGSINITTIETPGVGTNMSAKVTMNLWTSEDGKTSLDFYIVFGRSFEGSDDNVGTPKYEGGFSLTQK